jgi:hypothetical protein
MESSKQPQESSSASGSLGAEFEQEIEKVGRSLLDLRERYAQMQQDKQRRVELVHRSDEVQKQLRHKESKELKAELKQIKEQVEALDNALGLFAESYLVLFGGSISFTKSGLQDGFWQVVRFGGLGVIIGWILKSLAE